MTLSFHLRISVPSTMPGTHMVNVRWYMNKWNAELLTSIY